MLLAAIARPGRIAALVGISTAADHFVTVFNTLPIEVSPHDGFPVCDEEPYRMEITVSSYYGYSSERRLFSMFPLLDVCLCQ